MSIIDKIRDVVVINKDGNKERCVFSKCSNEMKIIFVCYAGQTFKVQLTFKSPVEQISMGDYIVTIIYNDILYEDYDTLQSKLIIKENEISELKRCNDNQWKEINRLSERNEQLQNENDSVKSLLKPIAKTAEDRLETIKAMGEEQDEYYEKVEQYESLLDEVYLYVKAVKKLVSKKEPINILSKYILKKIRKDYVNEK